jgi:DNA polymerase
MTFNKKLEYLRQEMGGTTVVYGCGPVPCNLMLIGEAPGREEDLAGEPFIGRSGDLLNKMLHNAGLNRDDIYVTNIVKIRPRNGNKNRPPTKQEINICLPFLKKEMVKVKPKVIMPLGLLATKTILDNYCKDNVNNIFSMKYATLNYFHTTNFIVLPNYHPSFLLQYGSAYMQLAEHRFKEIRNYVQS